MNEFTKQELKEISECLQWNGDFSELRRKIQYMIDSYCDECNNSKKIDNMCDGTPGCCVYTCSNCKDIDNE